MAGYLPFWGEGELPRMGPHAQALIEYKGPDAGAGVLIISYGIERKITSVSRATCLDLSDPVFDCKAAVKREP